jgi:hypothetical protein
VMQEGFFFSLLMPENPVGASGLGMPGRYIIYMYAEYVGR